MRGREVQIDNTDHEETRMKKMHILVTGAGGKTGRHVVAALIARGARVRAWVHRPEQGSFWPSDRVQWLAGDIMDPDLWDQALAGMDAIYHIPPNMFPHEEALGDLAIEAAERAGVRRFVYHSVLHPQVEAMPHHWHKMRVEERLFASELIYTVLQPTAYMQNLAANWPAIRDQGIFRQPYSPNARISLIDLTDVAEAAATVLLEPGHDYAIYELAGTRPLSQYEVAGVFSRVLGRTIRAEQLSLDEWAAQASGLSDYARDTLLKMFAYYDQHGLAGNPNVLRWLLGRLPTSLDAYLHTLLSPPLP